MSAKGGRSAGGDEVGDRREKHVSVITRSSERIEHGDVYFRHSATHFAVSPDPAFPDAETVRYPKETLLRVEVTQHHSACFLTTATAGESDTLDVLRRFRDDAMSRSPIGRALVALYDAVSPPVASTLGRHPRSRTARVVRWLVEGCAELARRRDDTRRASVRLALSIMLTLTYTIGLIVAMGGHASIRTLVLLRGEVGSVTVGTGHEQPGGPADHDQHAEVDTADCAEAGDAGYRDAPGPRMP